MAAKKVKQKVTPLYEDTNRVDLDLDDSVILQLAMQAHRENITYKVYNLKGSCFVLRFHRKNYSDYDEIKSELLWLKNLKNFFPQFYLFHQ